MNQHPSTFRMDPNLWDHGPSPRIRSRLIQWLISESHDSMAEFFVLVALRFRRFATEHDLSGVMSPDHMHAVDVALVDNSAIVREIAASRRSPTPDSRVDVVLARLLLPIKLGIARQMSTADLNRLPMLLEVITDEFETALFEGVGSERLRRLSSYEPVRDPLPDERVLTPPAVIDALPGEMRRIGAWPRRPERLFHNDLIAYEVARVCDAETSPCEAVAAWHLIRARARTSDLSEVVGYEGLDEVDAYPDGGEAQATVKWTVRGNNVRRAAVLLFKDEPARGKTEIPREENKGSTAGAHVEATYPVNATKVAGIGWRQTEHFVLDTPVWLGSPSQQFFAEFQQAVDMFVAVRRGIMPADVRELLGLRELLLLSTPEALQALPSVVRDQLVDTLCGRTAYTIFTTETVVRANIETFWRPLLVSPAEAGGFNILRMPKESVSELTSVFSAVPWTNASHPRPLRQLSAAGALLWSWLGVWVTSRPT